ncbi:hypothetical protein [Streptomyces sp. H27-C3]|uniref:hypothetical protein n=1 Tax=Streptomyces sp. H27-C3 TaxID=3046305 RepID=UPI0024BA5181|nr:hypothetical protein [Streptomyces sp. H27-C3]MDJ0461911.1 hypothetical protein [Streptomyces sp. H27-C3]
MDPAVIAALISTPVALVAAGAAYAAGRTQSRGAHGGPVDSVRRAAQREAYAGVLHEAQDLATHIGPIASAAEQYQVVRRLGMDPLASDETSAEQAREALSNLPVSDLSKAVAVVRLEGPDHLADLANQLLHDALTLHASCERHLSPYRNILGGPHALPGHERRLAATTEKFIVAARSHLNRPGFEL